jgi:catechol 2,3-dioxygenase-like lactoylglutathione lyase family enzyme
VSEPVKQLRLVLETADLDAALTFYRDVLGLTEIESFDGPDGARVVILAVPSATIELANTAQVRFIDSVEVGRQVAHPYPLTVRVAFEVDDAVAVAEELAAGGAQLVAEPTQTPWNSLNARFEAPGGMQITAFQELGES